MKRIFLGRMLKENMLISVVMVLLVGLSAVSSALGLQTSKSILSSGVIMNIDYANISKLHVEGTQIVDPWGNPVKLSGFDVHGKWANYLDLAQPWVAADEADLDWMKSKGFNCVRVVMFWEDIEISDGIYNSTRLTELDNFIELCETKGIYVLLDAHQNSYSGWFPLGHPSLKGHGIPAWAGPQSYQATIEGRDQFILDLWANRGVASSARGHLVDFWKFLANRYKNYNCIFAYDLLNEPWAPWIDETIVPGYVDFFDKELAPAIRTADPNTTIAYSALNINVQWLQKQTLNNIVWIMSFYEYSYEENGDYYSSKRPMLQSLIQKYYNRFVDDFGTAFMFSEIGGDMTADNNLQWIDDSLDLYHQIFGDNASWLYWVYGKIGDEPDEGWYPRYNWDEEPFGTNLKDMPVVAILEEYT